MNSKVLSLRLDRVAKFVKEFGHLPIRLADIGSDHAYLPCHLVLNQVVHYAIAGEVVEGPYQSAVSEVARMGLTNQIDVRLANGLEAVQAIDHINTVTICGMGGILIQQILEAGQANLEPSHLLVLQPNMAEAQLRTWLVDNGYELLAEAIVSEHQHHYEIMVARKQRSQWQLTEEERLFGPYNLKAKTPAFYHKWQEELASTRYVLEAMATAAKRDEAKYQSLRQKCSMIEEVLNDESI